MGVFSVWIADSLQIYMNCQVCGSGMDKNGARTQTSKSKRNLGQSLSGKYMETVIYTKGVCEKFQGAQQIGHLTRLLTTHSLG